MSSKAYKSQNPARWRYAVVTLWLAVLAAALIAINPIGYIGGHWDDGRYLASAQQWAAFGPQLGHDHWSLRSTVIAPTAIAIKVFGTTRMALMLPGLAIFALLLFGHFAAAQRAFGERCAVPASAALLSSPILVLAATRITADLVETLFWAIALWSYWFAGSARRYQRAWLVAAGFATGLAFATRETALGLCLILALGWLLGWRRSQVSRRAHVWILLGFAVVLLPELASFALASGDAFYRIRIDLAHVTIASTNLDGLTFAGDRILLNPELMVRWHGTGPIRLHWAADPWLNLFANPGYGLGFLAPALALLAARRAGLPPQARALIGPLVTVVMVQVAVVIYVIATDPKPRIFMPALLPASLIFGIAAQSLGKTRGGGQLVAALLAAKLIVTVIVIDLAPAQPEIATQAAAALTLADGPVHVSPWTQSELALASASVRARLTTAPARRGDLALTVDRPGGIDDGIHVATDTLMWRSPPGRVPFSVAALAKVTGREASALLQFARDCPPVVSLYRRAVN